MMKRLVSFVFTLLVVLSILTSESMAETPKVSLVASQTSVNPGDTVTFTVRTDGFSTKSLGIIPEYDNDIFELVSGEWLTEGAVLSDFSAGCAVIAYTALHGFEGDVFHFTLKVSENAILSDSTVKCRVQAEDYSLAVPEVRIYSAAGEQSGDDPNNTAGPEDILPEKNGNVFVICICGAVLMAAIVAVLLIRRKRKG